ncbi:MAG: sodium ion-translocating decarboxylase subunit beta [Sphaerochaeta sp.]|uniref:sodium ion-translocating decarboxylase subunit beta n=1 Tax=Sphaerochaeta sp. TaxID=1972642 RepID=UPI001DDFD84D|nr:sodium ion-translocating decarboxylase subunit beta [uncultured Sphaerochaeta sp.]MDD3059001.1 sodium ion-translocating decarboxylase subunit beta [Sphaerochaeta sp.]MDD3930013.1 sodium ion-translocating decarboxylase subunit beta [Sphaerochaeta sp.]NCC14031.1 sodium ion-translocating decarboxylase subunit beta [Spirochaetia bacterium]NCC91209.1 sodium ion-translocating decarboxylase subunit beta [Spirochaetia bacterium]
MDFLLDGLLSTTWKQLVMFGVGGLLIYLAIAKKLEPSLLLPMGFGAILVNLPFSGAVNQMMVGIGEVPGILDWLFHFGIEAAEAMPLLLFIGIGAMIDFGPLLANPKLILFGAAAQWGIFATISLATLFGFSLVDAASIGIIGAADGPTSILVSQVLGSTYIGPIAIAAYSYMALVPIIQPFAIKLVTTKKERMIHMPYNPRSVSKRSKILFPIIVTMVAGYIAPASVSLVGMLMFGNLIRECTVLDSLSTAAQTVLVNLITLLLGITIASTMKAESFVTIQTIMIMALGLAAFVFDTIAGVLFAKILNLFVKQKVNPMVGAAGISAFPMSARVIQRMGQQADPQNHLLMHAVGANVAGQIASVIAGGVILGLVPGLL